MHGVAALRSVLLSAALLLAGCDSADDPKKELSAISSRGATAQLVTGEWVRGAVTAAYASSTLRILARNLDKDSSSLAALRLSARQRDGALAHLKALSLAVTEAGDAVSKGSQPAARHALLRIGAETREFDQPARQP
ncbi:MAG: hypothetical protein M3068_00280 [Gemmatimonadota bacterium]|nr:hypothetical protein [Gemmatimonadota bacterium]